MGKEEEETKVEKKAPEAVAEETAEVEAPAETVETKEEEIDIDLNDPSVEESAVKIQAAFRGHQVRKERKEGEEEKKEEETKEEIDIDLNDPDTEAAAIKIQSAYRGHATRTELAARMIDEADE